MYLLLLLLLAPSRSITLDAEKVISQEQLKRIYLKSCDSFKSMKGVDNCYDKKNKAMTRFKATQSGYGMHSEFDDNTSLNIEVIADIAEGGKSTNNTAVKVTIPLQAQVLTTLLSFLPRISRRRWSQILDHHRHYSQII
ncbi:hypothetical protein BD770DRAFT_428777 [Pilaira anomala]|nr:hypothetical protein BD770DRAFT_428777 [Pilaira anomala]